MKLAKSQVPLLPRKRPCNGQASKGTRENEDGLLESDVWFYILRRSRSQSSQWGLLTAPTHPQLYTYSPPSLPLHRPGTSWFSEPSEWGSENSPSYIQAVTKPPKISINQFQMLHMPQKRTQKSTAPETRRSSSKVVFQLPEPAA